MDSVAEMLRLGSFRIHQSLVEKPLRMEDFWPLWWDKKKTSERIVLTDEMKEAILKAHGLN